MQFALIVPALTFALGFYPLLIDALPIDLNIETRAYYPPNANGTKLTNSNKIIISTIFGSFFLCYCSCFIACRRRKRRGQGRRSSSTPHRTSAGGTTTNSANNTRRTRRARHTENGANDRSARSTRTNGDREPVPGSTMSLPPYNEHVQDGEFVLLGQMRGVHDDEVYYNSYTSSRPPPGAPQATITVTESPTGDTNSVENLDMRDPLRSIGPGLIINTNDSSIDITEQAYEHTDTGVHTFDTLAHTSSAAALPHGGLPTYEEVTINGTTDPVAIPEASRAEEG